MEQTTLSKSAEMAERFAASVVLNHLFSQLENTDESKRDEALKQLADLVIFTNIPAEA